MNAVQVRRYESAAGVAEAAAEHFVTRMGELIEQQSSVHVLLTGGTVGIATLAAIAAREESHLLDWKNVHFWWGDERYVAADSQDRNAVQARAVLLSKIAIVEANVHEFPATDSLLDLEQAEHLFSAELLLLNPQFDLAFVGMGPDGHVCSLFPGKPRPKAGALVVAEPNSPKPPARRLSFTYEAMNRVGEIFFVVAGSDKAEAVAQVFDSRAQRLPAAMVSGIQKTIWFIDNAASGLIKG